MQPKDPTIFADVSEHFGIDNPAIAENKAQRDSHLTEATNIRSPFQ